MRYLRKTNYMLDEDQLFYLEYGYSDVLTDKEIFEVDVFMSYLYNSDKEYITIEKQLNFTETLNSVNKKFSRCYPTTIHVFEK